MISTGKSIPYILKKPILPLLDKYPDGKAWGMLEMKSDYKGRYFEIGRSSDATTLEIYGKSGQVDADAVLAFCGANTGYVLKTFDHGTDTVYMSQATKTKGPVICAGGAMSVNENGDYGLLFNSTSYMDDLGYNKLPTQSQFIGASKSNTAAMTYSGGSVAWMMYYNTDQYPNTSNSLTTVGSLYVNTNITDVTNRLTFRTDWGLNLSKVVSQIGFLPSSSWTAWRVGSYNASASFKFLGTVLFEAHYETDETANRVAMQQLLIDQYNLI
mgnify:CR=1 FL=1